MLLLRSVCRLSELQLSLLVHAEAGHGPGAGPAGRGGQGGPGPRGQHPVRSDQSGGDLPPPAWGGDGPVLGPPRTTDRQG